MPEAHTRVRNTGKVNRKEQEKHCDRLPRGSGERRKRSVSKTRACIINKKNKIPQSSNVNIFHKFGDIF